MPSEYEEVMIHISLNDVSKDVGSVYFKFSESNVVHISEVPADVVFKNPHKIFRKYKCAQKVGTTKVTTEDGLSFSIPVVEVK
ncbi:hypothetical protein [Vibrio phage phiKT1024]|nr:hypothetical protein [Vibrio phage phiKT1024]